MTSFNYGMTSFDYDRISYENHKSFLAKPSFFNNFEENPYQTSYIVCNYLEVNESQFKGLEFTSY